MQYIALDGDSLTTEDLVNLGKGHYKIKVWRKEGGREGESKASPLGICAAQRSL